MSGLENSSIGFDKVTFPPPKTLKRSIFTFDRGVKSKNVSFVSTPTTKNEISRALVPFARKENI